MSNKAKIKVIKKNEVKVTQEPQMVETQPKREAARAVVSTVTNWVSDFQTRKRDETKAAFERFLTPNPRPSES
ncbi:MAG: hypothetical protein ACR2M8_11825 [Pyrinomonadaceae bacterium]|nr:hypothetical protein [Blastocatellia bacterium]MDQ3490197.1 hypothetical protein [Acidobacteriota bacterium]